MIGEVAAEYEAIAHAARTGGWLARRWYALRLWWLGFCLGLTPEGRKAWPKVRERAIFLHMRRRYPDYPEDW